MSIEEVAITTLDDLASISTPANIRLVTVDLGEALAADQNKELGLDVLGTLYATAAQGALADTAVQPGSLATVATSGDYNDLANLPTLGTMAAEAAADYLAVANNLSDLANAGTARTNLGAAALAGDTFTGLIQFSGTGHAGLQLNSLTDAERDALNPAAGMLIYNTDDSEPQVYDGSWSALGGGGVTDHSALSNLDYASAGHTGFAGTGAANTFTAEQTFDGGLTASDATYTNSERFGSGATILADYAVVIGKNATTNRPYNVIIGYGASGTDGLSNGQSVAIGGNASVTDWYAVAIGYSVTAASTAVVIGYGASGASGNTIIGYSSSASGSSSTTLGYATSAAGQRAAVVGALAKGRENDTVAIGYSADAKVRATAVGAYATALYQASIALGYHADTTKANQFVIGSAADPVTEVLPYCTTSKTNSVHDLYLVNHKSSGTPAAGFGAGILYQLESSTTEDQSAGRLSYEWATATHATRKARAKWTVYDTAEREGIRIEASGAAPMIGFLGATAVVRQAHIADPSGGGTQDAEARTAINSILSALETYGLLATS